MLRSYNKGVVICSEDLNVEEVAKYLHTREEVTVLYKNDKRIESIVGSSEHDVILADSWQFYVTNESNLNKLPKDVFDEDNKIVLFIGYKGKLSKSKKKKMLFSLLDAVVEGDDKSILLEDMMETLFLMGACA